MLGVAQQIVGRHEADVTDALLVAHPRLEPRRVAHLKPLLHHRRFRALSHPLVVASHLGHLLEDVHAALLAARGGVGEVEGALAELLRELRLRPARRLAARPVVHGAALKVAQRVVRLLDVGPDEGVAAAVGVVLHRRILVRVAHRLRRRRRLNAQQRVVVDAVARGCRHQR